MSSGLIFNIQHYSIHDGPGIRTTVFLKGCPLRCVWCHNPESWSPNKEIGYTASKCIGCGICVDACKMGCHTFYDNKHCYNRTNCILCGDCVDKCIGAMEWIGHRMVCEEVMRDINRDSQFYENSGGGITISGGEPLAQAEFCMDLLKSCKMNSFTTCLQTSGYAEEKTIIKTMHYVDFFLFDYKDSNQARHRRNTGVDSALILSNLKLLDRYGAKTILRCPIIPNYNLDDEHVNGIIRLVSGLGNIIEIGLEPYHPLGSLKAEIFGGQYTVHDAAVPSAENMSEIMRRIQTKVSVPVRIL